MTVSLRPPGSRAVGPDGNFLPAWVQWLDAMFRAQPVPRSFTLDPASVSAGATSALTVAVERLTTDMDVVVIKPTHTAGLIVSGAYVSAEGELTIIVGNLTGSPIDAPSETWRLLAWRR